MSITEHLDKRRNIYTTKVKTRDFRKAQELRELFMKEPSTFKEVQEVYVFNFYNCRKVNIKKIIDKEELTNRNKSDKEEEQ